MNASIAIATYRQCKFHESSEVYFRKVFHPCLTIKGTQELAIYIGTLMTIDIQSSQPPCGIPYSTLCSSFSTSFSLSVDVLRLHCMFSCQDTGACKQVIEDVWFGQRRLEKASGAWCPAPGTCLI